MHRFSFELVLDNNVHTDCSIFGFVWKGVFITDPYSSDCSRFEVDPTEAYGISRDDAEQLRKLNQSLEDAVEDALNAGCLRIQNVMGVESGDFAGVYFSGDEQRKALFDTFAKYILAEYQQEVN